VRARLSQSRDTLSFRAICDPDMVGHLSRVISWAGGVIDKQHQTASGTILYISKK